MLSVAGEIDAHTANQLARELVAITESGRLRVVVDLSGVQLLDSSGVGVLIAGLERVRSRGGELRLAGAAPTVRRVFDITGLNGYLPVDDTVDDALRAME